MQRPDPLRCTYCGEISVWSAEQTDRTMIGEVHVCPSCNRETSTWANDVEPQLDGRLGMDWIEAEPLY